MESADQNDTTTFYPNPAQSTAEVYVVACEECGFEAGELSSSERYDVMGEHLGEHPISGPS